MNLGKYTITNITITWIHTMGYESNINPIIPNEEIFQFPSVSRSLLRSNGSSCCIAWSHCLCDRREPWYWEGVVWIEDVEGEEWWKLWAKFLKICLVSQWLNIGLGQWFGILRVSLSNNRGIPGIQTTNPNQQLTIGWFRMLVQPSFPSRNWRKLSQCSNDQHL